MMIIYSNNTRCMIYNNSIDINIVIIIDKYIIYYDRIVID